MFPLKSIFNNAASNTKLNKTVDRASPCLNPFLILNTSVLLWYTSTTYALLHAQRRTDRHDKAMSNLCDCDLAEKQRLVWRPRLSVCLSVCLLEPKWFMKSSLQNVIEQHEVRDTGRGQSHTLLQIVNGLPLFCG